MVNESLDITTTLLERFGGVVTAKGHQAQLQPALLPLLDDRRVALRKRAITALGAATILSCKYVRRQVDGCPDGPVHIEPGLRACLMCRGIGI